MAHLSATTRVQVRWRKNKTPFDRLLVLSEAVLEKELLALPILEGSRFPMLGHRMGLWVEDDLEIDEELQNL